MQFYLSNEYVVFNILLQRNKLCRLLSVLSTNKMSFSLENIRKTNLEGFSNTMAVNVYI